MITFNPKNLINSRKKLIIFAVFIFVTGYLGWKTLGNKQQTPQYQTAAAEKGTLVTSVSASGNISAGSIVIVSTQATGIVNQVYVKNGDTVTQGQEIADITLDSSSQQKAAAAWSSYLSAQNGVSTANQNKLTMQQSILQDQTDLLTAQGNASGTDGWDPTSPAKQKIDNARRAAELALEASQMKLTTADTQITKAQSDLSSSWLTYQAVSGTITAPTSGVINNLTIASGSPITPQSASSSSSNSQVSQKVAAITIPNSRIQAIVNLSQVDAAKVSAGQKATLTLDAYNGKTFTGKVLLVDTNGQISSGVTNYPSTIALDTDEGNIYPNMSVTAKIITSVKNDVILVPVASVQAANGQSSVRILKNGEINTVSVEIGDSNDTQTEIISGINEGDVVVTSQTGETASQTGTQGTSPFGAFGGGRGFGGGGGLRGGGGGGAGGEGH